MSGAARPWWCWRALESLKKSHLAGDNGARHGPLAGAFTLHLAVGASAAAGVLCALFLLATKRHHPDGTPTGTPTGKPAAGGTTSAVIEPTGLVNWRLASTPTAAATHPLARRGPPQSSPPNPLRLAPPRYPDRQTSSGPRNKDILPDVCASATRPRCIWALDDDCLDATRVR